MSEKRAGDIKEGDRFREIGDLDETFHEVTYVEHKGDAVVIAVPTANGESDYDRAPLDRDEVVEVLDTYLVSFGSYYRTAPHPVLGYWPELGQDAVLEVYATDEDEARDLVLALIGKEWCAIYGPSDPPGWEVLNLGSMADAVAEPKDSSWTVGIQLTLNADGSLEIHMEDAADDLASYGAPPALTAGLSETLERYDCPTVDWGKPSTP